MEWVLCMAPCDEQNLVDRFLKVVAIDDNDRYMDREEIRKRLAMGSDDYYIEKFSHRTDMQGKLHSGASLRICFMNETMSDTDSPNSNSESPEDDFIQLKPIFELAQNEKVRPTTLNIPRKSQNDTGTDVDFFTKQEKLQTEVRIALVQAKEMARMQMQIERQLQKKSPISELIRGSLEKIGISFPEDKRRLSRQILTEMNIAQLQVIVNDLHSRIETLNDVLVGHLMERDDLHMEQDSMLVDIEDLTKYFSRHL
ncbi:unnamed protein product [Callosobruchus maculatus]|uniref:Schwannomin interacting protein 1 C-terminal domain-containing protein n=3 Tax=Callosobruchus maculatus TaxID=64391 RepID=A0A653BNW1_CALMS|nr:unnamed protein product [Callosobruchus maculatus]